MAPLSPTIAARLAAVTPEAEGALGGVREVRITKFPFKVGRERRSDIAQGTSRERRHSGVCDINDLYLVECSPSSSMHISGHHFSIEYADGHFYLVDRHSACGTIVRGRRIGGNREGGREELADGDEILVGTSRSPYVFRFEVLARESA